MRDDLLLSYEKAKKVVESCQNELQLPAARKYINLFIRKFSKPIFSRGMTGLEVEKIVTIMYEELEKSYYKQKKKLVS